MSNSIFLLVALYALFQSGPPADPKFMTITPYWDSFNERVAMDLVRPSRTTEDMKAAACAAYKDPTHCERTVWEMIQSTTINKRWLKIKGSDHSIYTISTAVCKSWQDKKQRFSNKCPKIPETSNSYDALADDQWLYVRFESPTNENIFEAFYIFDRSQEKINVQTHVQPSTAR